MDDVARIQCPTLIIEPGAHTIGTGSAFAEMEKRIPKADRIVYENARHNLYSTTCRTAVLPIARVSEETFPRGGRYAP